MNDILFKAFPFLKKHMSNRASSLLSGFGLTALLAFALYVISLSAFNESSGVFFIVFLAVTAMIPVSFLILWMLEIKHKWDMRAIAVIPPSGQAFPQNAINAKKAGCKFRKLTKEEKIRWSLDKKDKLSVVFKRLLYVTNEEIESKRLDAKLSDPSLPTEEFRKIRNEQERKRLETKNS
jgi:hypothetical protein